MKTFLTKGGKIKLQEELRELQGPETKRLLTALEEARDKGDLSENAEYEAAKEAYEILQIRISKLESTLVNSSIIQKPTDISKVDFLTTVTVKDVKKGTQNSFTIVPENEIDLKTGKISMNSPIGKGLMNKKIGEVAKITIPSGMIEFEVLDIK